MASLKIALKQAKDRITLALGVLLAAVYIGMAILSLVTAHMLGALTEELVSSNDILRSAVILALTYLVYYALQSTGGLLQQRFSIRITAEYRASAQQRLIYSSLSWIESSDRGSLISKLSNDIYMAAGFLGRDLCNIFHIIVHIIVSIVGLWLIDYKIPIYLALIIGGAVILQMFSSRPIQKFRVTILEYMGLMTETIRDTLENMEQILVYNQSDWANNNIGSAASKVEKQYAKMIPAVMAIMSGSSLLSVGPLVFLAFFGVHLNLIGQISLAELVTIITIGIPLMQRVTSLL